MDPDQSAFHPRKRYRRVALTRRYREPCKPRCRSSRLCSSRLSLGWQGASFALAAGRPRAVLGAGVINRSNRLVYGPASEIALMWNEKTDPSHERVVVVEVANAGRMPITVRSCAFVSGGRTTQRYIPSVAVNGPSWPYRLEPGTEQRWSVRADLVHHSIPNPVRAEVRVAGRRRPRRARGELML